jgi:hypothetical protein
MASPGEMGRNRGDNCGSLWLHGKDWRKSMELSHTSSAYGIFENLRFHDKV